MLVKTFNFFKNTEVDEVYRLVVKFFYKRRLDQSPQIHRFHPQYIPITYSQLNLTKRIEYVTKLAQISCLNYFSRHH